jgi:hypothetical protein
VDALTEVEAKDWMVQWFIMQCDGIGYRAFLP